MAAAGGCLRDIFICPHRPDEACACRKPKPGMIQQARERYDIELGTSIMVGDSARDILCGRNAGCGATVLVLTGNGPTAEQELIAQGVRPTAVVSDLFDAAQAILSGRLIVDPC